MKLIIILCIGLSLISGCSDDDSSIVITSSDYCANKGGIVYVDRGAHPGAIYCANGDHTHKGNKK